MHALILALKCKPLMMSYCKTRMLYSTSLTSIEKARAIDNGEYTEVSKHKLRRIVARSLTLHRISGPLSFVFPVTAAHAH